MIRAAIIGSVILMGMLCHSVPACAQVSVPPLPSTRPEGASTRPANDAVVWETDPAKVQPAVPGWMMPPEDWGGWKTLNGLAGDHRLPAGVMDYDGPLVLYLMGVGGPLNVDDTLALGLYRGGVPGLIARYDWTAGDPGVPALMATERNQYESARVAALIMQWKGKHPNQPVVIVSHSGGTAIAAWALEKLPANVKVNGWILLASGLSPQYDLSRAMGHVAGEAHSFYSEHDDIVLGAGTRVLGSMDRVYGDAAGRVGFARPAGGDAAAYARLKQHPYEDKWIRLDNFGDHIGWMEDRFAAAVLAPLVAEPLMSGAMGK